MAIFQSAGDCINPYLDVTTGTKVRDDGREFTFKAFTFDSNTQDDTITIVSDYQSTLFLVISTFF